MTKTFSFQQIAVPKVLSEEVREAISNNVLQFYVRDQQQEAQDEGITALYERLSQEDKLEGESNSIANQKKILERYCREHGITAYRHYDEDDGYSGTNFNRPGFQRMLADIKAGKIKRVIVKDMSRFGRDYLQVGFYTDMLFPDFGAAAADPELSVVLLRYFNPIGAHPSGRIGEDPNGIPNNLLPFITQVAIGKRERLSIFGNDYPTPDGTGVRDYIHVVDLAKGHVAALRYAEAHTGTEIFNLGTGTGYSVLDIVHAFERVNHLEIPYVITDRRPGDVAECYADPTKAEKVLGWRAELDLDAMCRDAWNWQRQNPNGYDEP